jgi:hypothetical protein
MNRPHLLTRPLTLAAALVFLPACESSDAPATTAAAADAGAASTKDEPGPSKEPAKANAPTQDELVANEKEPLPNPTTDDLDPKVSKAASIAREIESAPSDADAILQRHGLDRDGLDRLMYDIARNPDLSRAYRDARTS